MTQYEKLITYFIEIFVSCVHLLPHEGLYRSFRGVIECGGESKSRKAYLLIKNIVEICERVFEEGEKDPEKDKQLKLVLTLVRKSG